MTRSFDEYRRILTLWEEGYNKSSIEMQLNIPRATIRDCIDRYGNVEALEAETNERDRSTLLNQLQSQTDSYLLSNYAYVLGMYLGDGEISKIRNIYRMRVCLDYRYPGIIQECMAALQVLFRDNKIGVQNVWYKDHISYSIVLAYYKYLPDVFPQHGSGAKHMRSIALHQWQQEIVEKHTLEFFRGLYHSDGCRSRNLIKGKDYPRYQFTNVSTEIVKMFCDACDRLGIHWTSKVRSEGYKGATDIFIARRKDVAFLDQHIGAKT